MNEFSCKTRLLCGRGSLRELKKLGAHRVLLVADPYFIKNGTAGKIGALTGAEQIEVFGKVQPDPSAELAAEGTALVKAFKPDLIIALGGGSAMDCAKAMGYFAGGDIPLAAVPTTSGSGSEVTDFSILTHGGIKYPLVDPALQPDVAILDGELLDGLPASLIADSGFDVLSHALEALAATGAGPFTDVLALDAFSTVFTLLPRSFRGDLTVRQTVHNASAMAGLAFNRAGLGLCHGMSHALGGLFHVPHGRLNAILLPHIIKYNRETAGEKYAEAARRAGLSAGSRTMGVRALENGLCRLRRELHLPGSLLEAGVAPAKVLENREKIVEAALGDACCTTNPVPVTRETVLSVLTEVTGLG